MRLREPNGGATEAVRALAAVVLAELDHAGEAGIGRHHLACAAWASAPSVFRAIQWLRQDGIVVEVVGRDRFRLAPGSRRSMSAEAMSRRDLVDELGRLLGTADDPLETLARMVKGRRPELRCLAGGGR